ncbi:MAG: hypothetical protein AAF557_22960 [Pseudomonadota bacterium]
MIWPFKKKERQVSLLPDEMCRIDLREKYTYLPLRKINNDIMNRILIVPKTHIWIEPLEQIISEDEIDEILEFAPAEFERRYRMKVVTRIVDELE